MYLTLFELEAITLGIGPLESLKFEALKSGVSDLAVYRV
jgi:hypothetical protein